MHSPQSLYGENMAINFQVNFLRVFNIFYNLKVWIFQNFWLSPTNLLDDNAPIPSHHIKSEKFRSQSLSPTASNGGVQTYSKYCIENISLGLFTKRRFTVICIKQYLFFSLSYF